MKGEMAKVERCASLTRRNAIGGFAVSLLAALLLPAIGCSQPESQRIAGEIDVNPVFDEKFEEANRAIADRVDDGKLVAVRSRKPAEPGGSLSWQYYFVSRRHSREYTVSFEDGEARVLSRPQDLTYLQSEMEAIPDAAGIAIDAPAAYRGVVKCLESKDKPQVVSAYLMLYIRDEQLLKSGNEEGRTKPMVWYFVFNDVDEVDSAVGAEDEEMFAYSIDAQTGEVSRV